MLLMCGEQIFVTDYAFTNKTFYKHDPVFVFNSLIFHSFPGYPYIQMLGCLKNSSKFNVTFEYELFNMYKSLNFV